MADGRNEGSSNLARFVVNRNIAEEVQRATPAKAPRVVELFEARKPREAAIMAEINGVVKYGEISKVQRRIISWATTVRSANIRCRAVCISTCRKASA